MKTLFKEQIEGNAILTEVMVAEFEDKTYHSGRPIQVGDTMLYGLLNQNEFVDENEVLNREITMEMLNEQDFDLYEPYEQQGDLVLPTFKLK